MLKLFFILLCTGVHCIMADIDDDILIPCARGTDVVLAVVKKIECTGIFPPENQLLRRIASVESDDGWDRKTCRSGYQGGIWQVDKIGFMHTQDTRSHRNLLAKFEKIKKHFCIDWSEVTWEDLRKPLYSGLAARLVLSIEPTALPPAHQIRKQAEYWRDFYKSKMGSEGHPVWKFIKKVSRKCVYRAFFPHFLFLFTYRSSL